MRKRLYDCFLVVLLLIFLSIPLLTYSSLTYSKPKPSNHKVYISNVDLYEDHYAWVMALGIEVLTDEPDVEENDVPEVSATYEEEPQKDYIKINSTAYYNKYNAYCADGTWPKPGVLAGKTEWIGKSVELYDSEYNYMGDYTFHDVGYGKSVGYGRSVLHKGEALGDIEAGVTIDIFMNTLTECQSYGRKEIYLVWK